MKQQERRHTVYSQTISVDYYFEILLNYCKSSFNNVYNKYMSP